MLKDSILYELKEQTDTPVSGQELADRYQVSRNAVWKAVRSLKEEGYPILTVGRKGYRLNPETDLLTESAVRAFLPPHMKDLHIRIFRTIDSTNSESLRMLAAGFSENALILTENQTKGQAHEGKSFSSPTASGLYMTYILHKNIVFSDLHRISSKTAQAVVQALNSLHFDKMHHFAVRNKHDIFDNDHKVCGILSQALTTDLESGCVQNICIGIGIYLNASPTDSPGVTPSPDFFYIGSSADRSRLAAVIAASIDALDFSNPEDTSVSESS